MKNLERVQGDERDAIILAVGYGKTADGTLPHRFGPLNVEGGERRLNVAVSRAKRRMTVVSSFRGDDVDPARSPARGVRLLKAFLDYAARGGVAAQLTEDTELATARCTGGSPTRFEPPDMRWCWRMAHRRIASISRSLTLS